jgi:hypothetical protein
MVNATNIGKKPTGRPRKGAQPLGTLLGLRLDSELLARIDAYAADTSQERTDAARQLIRLGLAAAARRKGRES